MEKKAQAHGRAHKRQQYNRRFVNVVAGFGGKKVGPNNFAALQERLAKAAGKAEK